MATGIRKDCAVAVDHVQPEQDGDMKARFIDGDVLPAINFLGLGNPEDGTSAEFAAIVFCGSRRFGP